MRQRATSGRIANIVGLIVVFVMVLGITPLGAVNSAAPPAASPAAAPPAAPPQPAAESPAAARLQQGTANTLRIYGLDSQGAGDPLARDPVNTARRPEDLPYSDYQAVFEPQEDQAPMRDSVTWNPLWMYEGATHDENWAKGLYNRILIPDNASEKVWFRMWYEPQHWDKDLNANGTLDLSVEQYPFQPRRPVTDAWYPALMQEFTYLLMEGKQLTAEPPPVATWGNVGSSFVFPVGQKFEDLFTPNWTLDLNSPNAQYGHGLSSLDADFDGNPDIVYVESEASLLGMTDIAADFDGNNIIDRLDKDATALNGNELAVLRLDTIPVQIGKAIQFLDHLVIVEQVYDTGAQLGIYYTGDRTPRYSSSPLLGIGDMALAGSQGPAQLIRAVANGGPGTNLTRGVPTGPWFVWLANVDRDEETAILVLGRAVGNTYTAMEDTPYREDRRSGDPWFLKRFYVDGHEYSVVALMTRNGGTFAGWPFTGLFTLDADQDGRLDYDPFAYLPDVTQFQFITIRTPLPKTEIPYRIDQHSVTLQNYLAGDGLTVMPPFNYEHYIIEDVQSIEEFAYYSVDSVGNLVGPVPPILSKGRALPYAGIGPYSPYNNCEETRLFWVEEDKNPQFLGHLRELYSERPDPYGEYWSTRQFWTRPWEYTDIVFPDIRPAITGQDTPDLYLLKSSFYSDESEFRVWLRTGPRSATLLDTSDPFPLEEPVPVKFWFDPAEGGKKYKDEEGLRIYGDWIHGEPVRDWWIPGEPEPPAVWPTWTWPFGITGYMGAGDTTLVLSDIRSALYPVEVLPYSEPTAPLDPDHPQAPRKDFVTLNPAIMNENLNNGEPLRDLYQRISIREANAAEKVFFRQWYEPSYVDKILDADINRGTGVITPTAVFTFPAIMQEFTYMYLDMNNQPYHGQPGKSQFAFPIATTATQLPAPVDGAIPANLRPSFGYGLTTFDSDFDGVEDVVTIHSERTLSDTTGIRADFDGSSTIDTLDPDGVPLNGDEMVVFTVDVHLLRGQSAQLLDHMITLNNVAVPASSADIQVWYTGGGTHPDGSYPDKVGSVVTLRPGEMVIASRTSIRRILAGGNNLGGVNGAWFVYLEAINSRDETVRLKLGRALGHIRSAMDNGMGAHDLLPGDPWYLKRFFVDGHEYNVVALYTVPNTLINQYPMEDPREFKYITIRTPVPKPDDFNNTEDSQVLQGYGLRSAIYVMPPYNYPHSVLDDIQRQPETWINQRPPTLPLNRVELTFGNPYYMAEVDPYCIGPLLSLRDPLAITIVGEAREPQFWLELKEILDNEQGPRPVWLTYQIRTAPDKYTELHFPDGELYLLTSAWRTDGQRANFECTQYLPPPGGVNSKGYRVMFWYDPTDEKDVYINTTETGVTPTAAFSANPTSGAAPLEVHFTDLSTGDITSWLWDFGDLSGSALQNPVHTYNGFGVYTVTLTVTGPCGSDSEQGTITVTGCAQVYLQPASQQAGVGQSTTVDIVVQGVSNLYGVDMRLAFDYTRLQVLDANITLPGVQIQGLPFFDPSQALFWINDVSNSTGVITYALTLQSPLPPVSGSGAVARITFQATSLGTAGIVFTGATPMLVDVHGVAMCSQTTGGTITVVTSNGAIAGLVSLQARSNHGGTTVTATGLPPVTTAADGSFNITGVPASSYTVTASKPGYLTARKLNVAVSAGSTTTLPNTTLLGGDGNNDGTINIVDLVLVGADFHKSVPPANPQADINGDGNVNLTDLVLVGSNYDKTGPTDWGSVAAVSAAAPGTAKVSLSPGFGLLPSGARTTVEVRVDEVSDLFGGEFELSFDPTKLQVVDADAATEGVQIAIGDVLPSEYRFAALNSVDNVNGKIEFAATLLSPASPVAKGGVLARITFKSTGTGPSALRFGHVQLLTENGSEISVKSSAGSLWTGWLRGLIGEPTAGTQRLP